MEACFECFTPTMHLRSVCLSCARNCVHMYRLRPFIRQRIPGETLCDCRRSGFCKSRWTSVRAVFDKYCEEDGNLPPRKIRALLRKLRAPFPIEATDVEDALSVLAEGIEKADLPRIGPVAFEDWYRKFYDDYEDINQVYTVQSNTNV